MSGPSNQLRPKGKDKNFSEKRKNSLDCSTESLLT